VEQAVDVLWACLGGGGGAVVRVCGHGLLVLSGSSSVEVAGKPTRCGCSSVTHTHGAQPRCTTHTHTHTHTHTSTLARSLTMKLWWLATYTAGVDAAGRCSRPTISTR
jgi:hypothetical protein